MEFFLAKRDGTKVRCLIPCHYTVAQAKGILAERAGYEPMIADEPLSVRLAVETETDRQLLPDEKRFGDLEEGQTLTSIPSLAPARCEGSSRRPKGGRRSG
jgi:hypothetical protein